MKAMYNVVQLEPRKMDIRATHLCPMLDHKTCQVYGCDDPTDNHQSPTPPK